MKRIKYLNLSIKKVLGNKIYMNILINDTPFRHHITISKSFLNNELLNNKYIFFELNEFKEFVWNSIYDKLKIVHYMEECLKIKSFNINGLCPNILETFTVNDFSNDIITQTKELFKYNNIRIVTQHDIYRYLIKMYQSLFGTNIVKKVSTTYRKSNRIHKYDINIDYLLINYDLMIHRTVDRRIISKDISRLLGIQIDIFR